MNSVIREIIELIEELIEFRNGPYYADVGDFSSAGTASIEMTLDRDSRSSPGADDARSRQPFLAGRR